MFQLETLNSPSLNSYGANMFRVTFLVVLSFLTQLSGNLLFLTTYSLFRCKCFLLLVSEPEISPSSKIIDVNEDGSYSIEFIENNTTDIRQCFYLSDTISGSFDVVKPETNDTKITVRFRYIV